MSVTPDFVGQIYKDTNTGNLWRANSLTPGDWTLELQNMQLQWEPRTVKLGEKMGYFTAYSDIGALSRIVFLGTTSIAGFDIENTDITELYFPNLTSIDPTDIASGTLYFTNNIVRVRAPLLAYISGFQSDGADFTNYTNLVEFDLSSLAHADGGLLLIGCTSLATLKLQSLLDATSGLHLNGCSSLTQIDVSACTTGSTFNLYNCAALQSIDLSNLASASAINANSNPLLTSLLLDSLVSTDALAGDLNISSCTSLTSLSLPSLTSLGRSLIATGCTNLTNLDMPLLVTASNGLSCQNAGLVTVNIPNYIPTNGKSQQFSGCALNASSVNTILARCVANAGYVSGGVLLSGGTNAAPTGQGIVDKATLNARQPGLAVTN